LHQIEQNQVRARTGMDALQGLPTAADTLQLPIVVLAAGPRQIKGWSFLADE
jgi:hypothetical protein